MGKHDAMSHFLHTPKKTKFVQPKPSTNNKIGRGPQIPPAGHSSYNLVK